MKNSCVQTALLIVFILSLFVGSMGDNLSPAEIEIQSRQEEFESWERIVGGSTVEPGIYPWFARLSGVGYLCGGVLISPEYLLTAAHCVDGNEHLLQSYGSFQIGALCYPYKQGSNCGQDVEDIAISIAVVHPRYNRSTFENDFALIRLEKASYIDPVTLDRTGISNFYTAAQRLFAVGFGMLQYDPNSNYLPKRLNHVGVNFVSDEECAADFETKPNLVFAPDTMFCAADNGKDACQGDSGGPIYDPDSGKLSGLVSWGIRCADPSYPGVYARVSETIPWIDNQVCNDNFQKILPSWCQSPTQHKECDGDLFQIDAQKDNSTAALRFNIKKKNDTNRYKISVKKAVINERNGYKSRSVCIPKNQCYQLIIVDKGHDGLCCSHGTGFVRISRNGEQIKSTRLMIKKRRKVFKLGACGRNK